MENNELPVGPREIEKWNLQLARYKAGKSLLDRRVRDAESWWLMRNRFQEAAATDAKGEGFRASSSWLHNVIASKHADAAAAYPVPNILPCGEEDREAAELLSKIVPAVLRLNSFEDTYDAVCWQKLKTGTGVYKVIWDSSRLRGLGDVLITRRSLLNLFWEPGVNDIQQSRFLFDVETLDSERLSELYPESFPKEGEGKGAHSVGGAGLLPSPMPSDEKDSFSPKLAVVDVYYHKGGLLHYCKYCGDTVIYSTENDPARRDRGLYDHGLFPYVFDPLFPVEGSPAGYGYVDIDANCQIRIDLISTALLRNTLASATPRYFTRSDGGINEEELLNLEKALVHVNGSLGEDYIRVMPTQTLSANHLSSLEATIRELRETSGNTETSTGAISGGVTAAAAIAALQDAAGKGSRAAIQAGYRAYAKLVKLVIELIRQYYDVPRQFRITGPGGEYSFVSFDNSSMQPRSLGSLQGVDLGSRLPEYDIRVEPEKRTAYTRLAQNELALQFYNGGFFNPQLADQSLKAIEMMDFEGREQVERSIAESLAEPASADPQNERKAP